MKKHLEKIITKTPIKDKLKRRLMNEKRTVGHGNDIDQKVGRQITR